jgi:hypothetical protein
MCQRGRRRDIQYGCWMKCPEMCLHMSRRKPAGTDGGWVQETCVLVMWMSAIYELLFVC